MRQQRAGKGEEAICHFVRIGQEACTLADVQLCIPGRDPVEVVCQRRALIRGKRLTVFGVMLDQPGRAGRNRIVFIRRQICQHIEIGLAGSICCRRLSEDGGRLPVKSGKLVP